MSPEPLKEEQTISLSHIVRYGFLTAIVSIIITFVITYNNFLNVSSLLTKLTEQTQPIAVQSHVVAASLQHTTSQLGFFLVNPTAVAKDNLVVKNQHLSTEFNKLKQKLLSNEGRKALIEAEVALNIINVSDQVAHLNQLIEQVITMASNPELNYPARGYYHNKVELLETQIQNIYSDLDEQVSDLIVEDKRFQAVAINLYRQNNMFNLIKNNTQTFLAHRSQQAIDDMMLYQSGFDEMITIFDREFSAVDEDLADGVAELSELMTRYQQQYHSIIKLHLADDWRRDAYLIRTQIEPEIYELGLQFNSIVSGLNRSQLRSSKKINNELNLALRIIMVISAAVIAVCCGVAYVVSTNLSDLNSNIKIAFSSLMAGEFETKMANKKIQETNELSCSYNAYIDSIRPIMSQIKQSIRRAPSKQSAADIARESGLTLFNNIEKKRSS